MQFRALGVLILPKPSSMIARKTFLQKLLLKKVSLYIDVTMSSYLLNSTKEDMTVLHSLLHLGKEGEWHLLCVSQQMLEGWINGALLVYGLLLCFPAQFLTTWPEQVVCQVRLQKVCLVGEKEWFTGKQLGCLILQDVNFALLLFITYNLPPVIQCTPYSQSGDRLCLLHGS